MKNFKNINSIEDLKNQYRALIKANHPDNGGKVEKFRNDYLGIYQEIFKTRDGKNLYSPSCLKDNDEFLYFWRRNLADQGFTPEVYRAEP